MLPGLVEELATAREGQSQVLFVRGYSEGPGVRALRVAPHEKYLRLALTRCWRYFFALFTSPRLVRNGGDSTTALTKLENLYPFFDTLVAMSST